MVLYYYRIENKEINIRINNNIPAQINHNKNKGVNIMNRQALIDQVKEEYASIASDASQQHFTQTTTDLTPEAYYENLLGSVIHEISKGTFDNCKTGSEIVNKVAADKSVLSDWKY